MKKNNLTFIIILSGIAAAICMLSKAFTPAIFKSLSTIIFMYVMLGVGILLAPKYKMSQKSFLDVLLSLVVIGIVVFLLYKVNLFNFITVPVIATIAAISQLILKNEDYALSTAFFASSAAVFSNGNVITFILLSVAFAVSVAALNIRKISNPIIRIATVFIICLALCAFK